MTTSSQLSSPSPTHPPAEAEVSQGTSQTATEKSLRRVAQDLLGQPLALLSLTIMGLVVLTALLAPLSPYGEVQQNLDDILTGPTAEHVLGTDRLGRDTATRLMYGARVALQAAIQSVLVAALIGVPLGLWVGYRGGWADRVVMRLVDVGDSVPGMFLAFVVIAVLGRGMTTAMIAVGLIFVSSYIRLTRACVLIEREKTYVDSARVMGMRPANILFRQILPNIASPLVVRTTVYAGRAILIEAALSFLGMGLDVNRASWGGMLQAATAYGFSQPSLVLAPGLAITFTVLALNIFGDCLRDSLAVGTAGRPSKTLRRAATLTEPRTTPLPPSKPDTTAVLAMESVSVQVDGPDGEPLTLVDNVSFEVHPGQILGVGGESGSGKTITGLAAIGMLPRGARLSRGTITVAGQNLGTMDESALRAMRGSEISMIFQDPIRSLSPVHTIGTQLGQAIRNGKPGMTRPDVRDRAAELLATVGIANPRRRLDDYPFQYSGGMAQRVGIAMALASNPRVLIADEPTTALDTTVQERILDLLLELRSTSNMSIVMVTHDMGVIADICDDVAIMYAGQVVEKAPVDDLFNSPRHPYTRALLSATSRDTKDRAEPVPTIPGRVPPAWAWPPGCRFHPRCDRATIECQTQEIPVDDGVRCIHPIISRQERLSLNGGAGLEDR
jgi:peptide/nickel transport system permease protein